MSILHEQTLYELGVGQGFTNDLAANLTTKGVPSTSDEGLDTLVPKVLQIESGVAKSPYDEWQEGFGANWDSVILNAPLQDTNRVLHIYPKMKMLWLGTYFNYPNAEVCTYNLATNTYRNITIDSENKIYLNNTDVFQNTHDGADYVCVIYANNFWNIMYTFNGLPMVYSNSKAVGGYGDYYCNSLSLKPKSAPLLRGVDCNYISSINVPPQLEHLTYQQCANFTLSSIYGNDTQARLLKNVVDSLPSGIEIKCSVNSVDVSISDYELADWFYNDFIYNYFKDYTIYYFPNPNLNVSRRFVFNPELLLGGGGTGYMISGLPNVMYLEGTMTENQTITATAGRHGFNKSWSLLKNFPMWTVLEGASTGCLLPAQSANSNANFRFYSYQLERSNFAIFNDGVIDLDPTKSFVANLPYLSGTVAQTITFDDTTFKNQFTAEERTQIEDLVVNQKKWGLSW